MNHKTNYKLKAVHQIAYLNQTHNSLLFIETINI